jgi:hypothetical protein
VRVTRSGNDTGSDHDGAPNNLNPTGHAGASAAGETPLWPSRRPLREGEVVHAIYLDSSKICSDPHCPNPKE